MEQLLQPEQEKIEEAIAFLGRFSSVILATVTDSGEPLCSYAPCINDGSHYYVYVSSLAQHAHTLPNGQASLLFIENEEQAKNVFARRRLSLDCRTSIVDRQSADHERLLDRMEAAHGSTLKLLRSLPDFILFSLTPGDARFVTGFGAAYDFSGVLPQLLEGASIRNRG